MEDKPVQPEWQWWDHLRRTGEFESPLYDGAVHYGYYRRASTKKDQNARWVPIGIWANKAGEVTCEIDGKKVDPTRMGRRPFDLLFSKSLQAVTHQTYMAVTRKGEPWPDAPPPLDIPTAGELPRDEGVEIARARPTPPDLVVVDAKDIPLHLPPPKGSNPTPQPPTPPDLQLDPQGDEWREVAPQKWKARIGPEGVVNDPTFIANVPASDREVSREDNIPSDAPDDHRILIDHQAHLAREEDLVRQRLLLPIQSQDEANATSEHANRIAALGRWFSDEYERRNRPLLEAQKGLRIDYLHPAQEAAGFAKSLTQHMATFLLAEQRKLEEEQRRAAEAEALRIQKAAEEAAAKGETITPEEVRPGAPPVPRRAGAGGLTGRRTTVSEEPVGTVTDYAEFAGVLIRGNMANPTPTYCSSMELKTCLDGIARKLAKTLPRDQKISGLQITTQAKARR